MKDQLHISIMIAIIFIITVGTAYGQQVENIEDIVEKIQNYLPNDNSPDQLYEDIEAIQRNPININTATKSELEKLFFLTQRQIDAIIMYKKIYGSFVTIYELQAIKALNTQTIQLMIPLITIENSQIDNRKNYVTTTGYQRLVTTLETPEGYKYDSLKTAKYNGNNYQLLSKVQLNYSEKVEANWVVEKDRGETLINPQSNTIDYFSGSLCLNTLWHTEKLIIGDYKVKFGQGLIANSNQTMGKSMPFDGVTQKSSCFTPYRSTNEAKFFRGGAATKEIGAFSISAFISQLKRDATLEIAPSGETYFTSIITNGLHRTTNELSKTNTITESSYGGEVTYKNNISELSFHTISTKFNYPFRPTQRPDIKGLSGGDEFTNIAISYRLLLKNTSLFGEIATDNDNDIAKLFGINLYPNDFTTCQFIYRQFPQNYFTLYGDAFSEGSLRNEEGYFLKLIINPIAKIAFTSYIDMYNFPGIRYNEIAPGNGKEMFLRCDYTPTQEQSLYLKVKYEKQQNKNNKSSATIQPNIKHRKWQTTIHLAHRINTHLRSKTHISYNYVENHKTSKGFLIMQDIGYQEPKKRYHLHMRYALFSTDDYNSRIYAYENSVTYSFAIPAYAGKGQRIYISGRWKITQKITIEAKLGRYTYWGIDEISSGNEQISGNHKTEAIAQIKWKL